MLLMDQVALITGAAQGIGRSIAERFAQEGAQVVVTDVSKVKGIALVDRLRSSGYDASFVEMDVTEERTIRNGLDRCIEAFGRLDILVNNAGVNVDAPVLAMTRDQWDKVLAVNLTGSFLCSQIFGRYLVNQGRGGSLIFISSQSGKRGAAGASAYSASKFGVLGLMECLALELAPHGIRSNAVCPGNVDAPMLHWLLSKMAERANISVEEAERELVRSIPLGRLAAPAEIADVCVFLASPLASYISGEAINVDGGELSG
jgi:NAD(P)-dependent dehydrogenase (short-subunit alcohol dehydrogenase family)